MAELVWKTWFEDTVNLIGKEKGILWLYFMSYILFLKNGLYIFVINLINQVNNNNDNLISSVSPIVN